MRLEQKSKQKLFIISALAVLLLFLLFYMRENRLNVDETTDISVEYNFQKVVLSSDIKKELVAVLNNIRIRHTLNDINASHPVESTAYIYINDRSEERKVLGVLTIDLTDASKGDYLGSTPHGRYRVNRKDMQKIIDVLNTTVFPLAF